MRIKSLISLLVLQLIVSLNLIAFNKLQPVILEVFDLSGYLFDVIVFQNLISLFLPILTGMMLDRYFSKKIFTGVAIGAVIIIASLSLLLLLFYGWLGNGNQVWLLLGCWFLGVKLFSIFGYTSLDQLTDHNSLPRATALIAQIIFIVFIFSKQLSELVYRTGPVVITTVLMLLVMVSYFLYHITQQSIEQPEIERNKKTSFGLILITGLLTGFFQLMVTTFLPIWVMAKSNNAIHSLGSDFPLSVLLIVSVVTAWPLADLISKTGVARSLMLSVAGCFLSLTFIFIVPDAYAALAGVILTGVAFAALFVSGLPFIIHQRIPENRFLALAVFFSSMELPGLILDIVRFGK